MTKKELHQFVIVVVTGHDEWCQQQPISIRRRIVFFLLLAQEMGDPYFHVGAGRLTLNIDHERCFIPPIPSVSTCPVLYQ